MDSPQTRASLLVRIRDASNATAWAEFVDLYAPLLHAYARRQGLQDSDAADLCQDILCNVLRSIGRLDYDRSRGTFRGWLLTVARNEIFRQARRSHRARGSGDSQMQQILQQQPSPVADVQLDLEHQQRLFQWAAGRVRTQFRDKTWRAFWSNVVEDQPAEQVADSLGMSVGAVYIARSRVTSRIREEIAGIEQPD